MKIVWATRLRGFLKHVSEGIEDINFVSEDNFYEVNTLKHKILSKLIHCKIFDWLGKFSVIEISGKDCDMYGSFNRFLKTDKPYFIYLENPTALYHYCLNRISYKSGAKKFAACLNDDNLKGIICMSDACRESFERINGKLPERILFRTIYPFVPDNKNIDPDKIIEKSHGEKLELLYCVQGVRFVSKGGLEVVEAVKRLNNPNIHLTVITKINDVDKKIIKALHSVENVDLFDFNFKYNELEKIYAKTNVLIQPTSDDSFGLTILEAMKGGCAILASDLYSISELVADGDNGFLVEPKYRFFDKENIPNPKVWNHRKKTIYSTKTSDRLVADLCEKISLLNEDRNLLARLSINSYNKSVGNAEFGEEKIKNDVVRFLDDCIKN